MPSSDPISRKTVHQALKTWDNARRLGELPLAHLNIIENQRQKNNYLPTPTGYGLALRETLQRALETLRPDGEPDPLEKRWRPYLLLTERYLNGRSPDFLVELLGIARSTFDHTQTDALETLADLLRQWEHTTAAIGVAQPGRDQPAHAWEGQPSPREKTSSLPLPFLVPTLPAYPLIGREGVFSHLKRQLLAESTRDARSVALSGLPGVGKTALVVALAHDSDLRIYYPDGVLWVGLGNHPNLLALLGTWGTALGLSPDELSKLPDLETRARALHAAIGLRKMLLVVDDAWSAADALAFKLGGPNCATLLTTRLPKIALDFAGENAHALSELSDEDGLSLLAEFAPHVIITESDAAKALVHAAGGLPLALTLMGRHLRKETHTGPPRRVRAAVELLQTTEIRLRLSQPASPLDHQPSLPATLPLSLLSVIAISEETLDPKTRQVFHALSVFPPKPNTFSERAALAVTEASLDCLDTLTDYGLLEFVAPDRYTLHPTLSEYARLELAEFPAEKTAAAQRMARHFIQNLPSVLSDTSVLDDNSENILAALRFSYKHQLSDELIQGANAFCAYLEAHGLYTLAEDHLARAETAARARSDPGQLLQTLNNLGHVSHRRGDYAQAEAYYREALTLSRPEDDPSTHSAVLQGLGLIALSRGDFPRAEEHLRESLVVARACGDPTQISAVLSNLGALHVTRGEYDQAGQLFEEGLNLARQAELRQQANALLTNLGVLCARRGDFGQARMYFEEALALARQMGHRSHTSYLLTNLGTLANDQGEQTQAVAYFQEGLALAREMGQRERVGHLLANLGALATDRKNFDQAQVYLDESLTLAREMGHRQNTIFALTNLGGLRVATGDAKQADAFLEEALSLAREIGQPGFITAILLEYGNLYLKRKDWGKAQQSYQEALSYAQNLGAQANMGHALFGLAQVAEAQRHFADAKRLGQESLVAYQKIGHFKGGQVRQWLDKEN